MLGFVCWCAWLNKCMRKAKEKKEKGLWWWWLWPIIGGPRAAVVAERLLVDPHKSSAAPKSASQDKTTKGGRSQVTPRVTLEVAVWALAKASAGRPAAPQ